MAVARTDGLTYDVTGTCKACKEQFSTSARTTTYVQSTRPGAATPRIDFSSLCTAIPIIPPESDNTVPVIIIIIVAVGAFLTSVWMVYHFITSKKPNMHSRLGESNNLSVAQGLNKDDTINQESPKKGHMMMKGLPNQVQMTPTTNQQMDLQSPGAELDPMASPALKKSIRKRVKNV